MNSTWERRYASVFRSAGSWAKAPYIVFNTGMISVRPEGMVQLRLTVLPMVPARYQFRPDCPWAQLMPESSTSGDLSRGMLAAHRHQSAAWTLYGLALGQLSGGYTKK